MQSQLLMISKLMIWHRCFSNSFFASKALAINEKTSEHGVTTTASNRVELQLDFDNVPTAATKTFGLIRLQVKQLF